jgi:hypothetical protein
MHACTDICMGLEAERNMCYKFEIFMHSIIVYSHHCIMYNPTLYNSHNHNFVKENEIKLCIKHDSKTLPLKMLIFLGNVSSKFHLFRLQELWSIIHSQFQDKRTDLGTHQLNNFNKHPIVSRSGHQFEEDWSQA